MIEDIIIGIMLGFFIFQGPFIAWKFIKMRAYLSKALKKAGTTLEELDKKPAKGS